MTKALLTGIFIVFNVFASVRMMPINSEIAALEQDFGRYDRRVYRVFNKASRNVETPYSDLGKHVLFQGRDPGMFLFISELFIRMGATTPAPIQVFCLVLFNIGLIFAFKWIQALFQTTTALFAIFFLVSTPFFLLHSTSIHQDAYSFLFFNATLYFFTKYVYLRMQSLPSGRFLFLTCLSFFMGCQNYWMYYVSTFLMMMSIYWISWKKPGFPQGLMRTALVVSVPPVVVFLSVVILIGGNSHFTTGLRYSISLARMRSGVPGFDLSIAPVQYMRLVNHRIHLAMGLPVWIFSGMLGFCLLLAGKNAWKQYRWLTFAIPASFSWNLIMVQHTIKHRFSGMYGYFLWILIVGLFFDKLLFIARKHSVKSIVIIGIAFFFIRSFMLVYVPELRAGVHRIATRRKLTEAESAKLEQWRNRDNSKPHTLDMKHVRTVLMEKNQGPGRNLGRAITEP